MSVQIPLDIYLCSESWVGSRPVVPCFSDDNHAGGTMLIAPLTWEAVPGRHRRPIWMAVFVYTNTLRSPFVGP